MKWSLEVIWDDHMDPPWFWTHKSPRTPAVLSAVLREHIAARRFSAGAVELGVHGVYMHPKFYEEKL